VLRQAVLGLDSHLNAVVTQQDCAMLTLEVANGLICCRCHWCHSKRVVNACMQRACVCVFIRLRALQRIKPYKKPLQPEMPFCSACISQAKMLYSRGLRLLPLRPTQVGASTLQGIMLPQADLFVGMWLLYLLMICIFINNQVTVGLTLGDRAHQNYKAWSH